MLKKLDRSSIITLDEGLFDSAIAIVIDRGGEYAELSSNNLLYYNNTQID
jgi:hypothetical protein